MIDNIKILERLKKEVKEMQSDSRFTHTMGVYRECSRLALIFGLDEEASFDLKKAAILHDITKDMSGKKQIELCNKYGLKPPESAQDPMPTVHQDTGAFYARETFGTEIVNDRVFYAVASHTTGRENMTDFDKLLFIADYIEPQRKYKSCIETREYLLSECAKINRNDKEALYRLLSKTVINVVGYTVSYLTEKKRMIDPRMIFAWNSMI